jgi:poly-gamma-glutamate capsule biosynthesis protein CapA/YwtB (metallophosphatase superfamily)
MAGLLGLRWSLLLGAAILLAPATGLAQPVAADAPSKAPEDFLRDPPKPASVRGKFSVVSIGDLLYSRPLADLDDPEFRKVLQIVQAGDVAIANQEGVFLNLKTYKGEAYGHGQLWGEGTLARDMKAMGFDMVSVAGNHSTDLGPSGLIETMRLLDDAGVAHAGGGRNLQSARTAGYFATSKGRVGLVATASTFKVNAGANDALGEVPERAGISILRTQKINLVPPGQMETVRRLATELASPLKPAPSPSATDVVFGDETYRLAPAAGLHYDMELYDHAGLLKAVRDAKKQSDLVVFTIHAHESPTGLDDDTPAPPDFLVRLFHDAVDAGADVIMGGGPHSLRGVEIYKGRPILYGLGLFFLKADIKAMQETVFRTFPPLGKTTPEARKGSPRIWFDSVVAVTEFDKGRARRVRLYPIDLMNTGSQPNRRGIPHLATGENATRILTALQRDSAALGTRIKVEDAVGIIDIP